MSFLPTRILVCATVMSKPRVQQSCTPYHLHEKSTYKREVHPAAENPGIFLDALSAGMVQVLTKILGIIGLQQRTCIQEEAFTL
ncbi:MAG: hypothetical protein A2Z25_21820 [Planctomycetes bacterium RBG_16_55_9]|nr:MAG: hypothetical protein A2Z25_21820 [Planctomycetes bacterium RBG_16_55_9]